GDDAVPELYLPVPGEHPGPEFDNHRPEQFRKQRLEILLDIPGEHPGPELFVFVKDIQRSFEELVFHPVL
ncbi:MAG: hypothetical protein JW843_01165, partial [Candidatus Aminicenantes bacterium]|nr:hypothetical protein [Candidatus Aminicenantes bacterium]